MPVFTVRRRIDAYVDYVAQVDARDAREAARVAAEDEKVLDWQEEGPCEFEDRCFIALDAQGDELEHTEVTSF